MFIIEADTPDELRLKLIRIVEGNAERCTTESHKQKTVKSQLRFAAQASAFRLLANDLKDTEIRPKPVI